MIKRTYTKKQIVFSFFMLLSGTAYYRALMHTLLSEKFGAMAFFAFGFVLLAGIYFILGKERSKEAFFFLALTALYALRLINKTWEEADVIDLIALFVIHLSALLALEARRRPASDDIIPRAFHAVFYAPFHSFIALFSALGAGFLLHRRKHPEGRGEAAFHIILGILLAVPLLIFVGMLLSSDHAFALFTDEISEAIGQFFSKFSPWSYINPITVLVSCYLYSALYESDRALPPEREVPQLIHATVIHTIYSLLLFLYFLFFAAQFGGYMALAGLRLPKGETYASFARSGFFQLCLVACINGVMLYLSQRYGAHKTKKTTVLSVILVVVTLLILCTAAGKMGLYIAAYGFTPKRFYTLWFMLLLSLLFILALVRLKKPAFPLSRCAVYITSLMLFPLFFIDFHALSTLLNG